MDIQHVSGCLFGMALGDALGAETEFLNVDAILQRFPPHGPQEPPGDLAFVTDDTQMALAVGEALLAAPRPYAPDTLGEHLRRTFLDWYDSPDNNRAPGRTCLSARRTDRRSGVVRGVTSPEYRRTCA
jgi:ADP-ribosylglycohydrolase